MANEEKISTKWTAIKDAFPAEMKSLCHYMNRQGLDKEKFVSLNDDQVAKAFDAWVKGNVEKFEEVVKG